MLKSIRILDTRGNTNKAICARHLLEQLKKSYKKWILSIKIRIYVKSLLESYKKFY